MRKALLLTIAFAVLLAPTAANAGSAYKIAVSVDPKLMDVFHRTKVTVSGRVTGGPVKGRSVAITAVNTNDSFRSLYLGTAKLSSSGRFSKGFVPPRGGRWTFKVVKAAVGSHRRATSSTRYVDAFQWALFHEFPTGLNLPTADTDLVQHFGTDDPREATATEKPDAGYRGFHFSTYAIQGGGTLVVDTRGYRCKKMLIAVGVSERSPADAGTISVTQGSRTLFTKYMRKGDSTFESSKDDAVRNSVIPQYVLRIGVAAPAVNAPNPRFVLGNGRAFCTFPSFNK